MLGSVLPDFLRLFVSKPRTAELVKFWESRGGMSADIARLIDGVHFHHEVDIHFHRSPLFRDNARALRIAMEDACDQGGLKRFFAAHLLLEIYLDHLLMAESPRLTGEFYRMLEGQSEGLLTEFVTAHPDVSPHAFKDFLRRFLADRFIEDYGNLDGIFYRAERMLVWLRQRRLTEPEKEAVGSFFRENGVALQAELFRFIQAMQQRDDSVAKGHLRDREKGPSGNRRMAGLFPAPRAPQPG